MPATTDDEKSGTPSSSGHRRGKARAAVAQQAGTADVREVTGVRGGRGGPDDTDDPPVTVRAVGHGRPVRREQGEPVVVAPGPSTVEAGQVEEVPRETLVDETERPHEPGGAVVGGLDVRLDAVQPHPLRRVGEDEVQREPQAFREEAATGIRVVGVVADRRAAEGAPDDVGDVDATDEPVRALGLEGVDHERAVGRRLVVEDQRQVVRVGHGEVREAPLREGHGSGIRLDVGPRRRPHLDALPRCGERPYVGGGLGSCRQRTTRPRSTTPIGSATTVTSASGSDA